MDTNVRIVSSVLDGYYLYTCFSRFGAQLASARAASNNQVMLIISHKGHQLWQVSDLDNQCVTARPAPVEGTGHSALSNNQSAQIAGKPGDRYRLAWQQIGVDCRTGAPVVVVS